MRVDRQTDALHLTKCRQHPLAGNAQRATGTPTRNEKLILKTMKLQRHYFANKNFFKLTSFGRGSRYVTCSSPEEAIKVCYCRISDWLAGATLHSVSSFTHGCFRSFIVLHFRTCARLHTHVKLKDSSHLAILSMLQPYQTFII